MEYSLKARVGYLRRPLASTLLFTMARRAAQLEEEGKAVEYFQGHLSIEGEYVGFLGWDDE